MPFTCEKCSKDVIDSICPACKETSKTLAEKFLGWFGFLFEKILVPVIVAGIIIYLVNPPQKAIISAGLQINTGTTPKVDTPFKMTLTNDPIPWLSIGIKNTGSNCDEQVRLMLSLKNDNRVKKIEDKYYPEIIKDNASKKNLNTKSSNFSETFSSFPPNCAVEYRITLERFLLSDKDYSWSLVSKSNNWTDETVIQFLPTSFNFLCGIAYAEEVPISSSTASPTSVASASDQGTPSETTASPTSSPGSGVSLGGYDPVIMANGLFQLLQEKQIFDPNDAFEVKNAVENSKVGVSFGGVNVAAFCEVVINKLISKKVVPIERAKEMIVKSQKAGGILIGGVNIIVLQVEVMNFLLETKHITLAEGQIVIDKSKR